MLELPGGDVRVGRGHVVVLELLGRVVLGVDGGVLVVELRELLRRDVRGGGGVKRVR